MRDYLEKSIFAEQQDEGMGGGGQEGGRQKGCDTECEQRRMGGEEGGLGSLGCLASPGNPYIRWQTIPGTPC